MEAVGELAPNQAMRLGQISSARFEPVPLSRTLRAVHPAGRFDDGSNSRPEPDGGGSGDLARCLELLRTLSSTAVDDAALLGFRGAADFADTVEEISRAVEYLQIVSAGAVERTRREAAAAARSATVGSGSAGWGSAGPGAAVSGAGVGWVSGWGTDTAAADHNAPPPALNPAGPDPADDGSRNAAEFLRARLRISIAEARRRIGLASAVLPRPGFAGHTEPPERPELAAAVAAGTVASRPATIITMALDRVRHHATGDTTARMEHALTCTAAEYDTDFLTRIARRWTDAIDQDGSEPSEEELRRRQGVFLRQARRGLQHIEIFATPDQCEPLLTVMNTATNPRTQAATTEDRDGTDSYAGNNADSAADSGDGTGCGGADGTLDSGDGTGGAADADLDRRTRQQRLLDGLVSACKTALTTGTLPAAGGLRPQVMVTIDYRDLLDRLEHTTNLGPRYRTRTAAAGTSTGTGTGAGARTGTGTAGPAGTWDPDHASDTTLSPESTGRLPGTGSFTFTGPVPASLARKIACDADIIPVLLGSQGRILDIGRTTRIFPPHIRKAITARDQGCAFPGCTIPAPWCEAHHITFWSHGGPTSTDNGTLLCSHHHHLIHKEQWTIQVKTGIPWFIPPPHIDPRQRPQQNNYFRC